MNKKDLYDYCRTHKFITTKAMSEHFLISRSTAVSWVNMLLEKDLIASRKEKIGRAMVYYWKN